MDVRPDLADLPAFHISGFSAQPGHIGKADDGVDPVEVLFLFVEAENLDADERGTIVYVLDSADARVIGKALTAAASGIPTINDQNKRSTASGNREL